MGRNVAVWPKRPFKITYLANFEKVGRVVTCASPEAVVRSTSLAVISGRADEARVLFDQQVFAVMSRQKDGAVRFVVF
jgi:hypothetical protein